jgi:hypothetical protein
MLPTAANVLVPLTGGLGDGVKICDFGSAVCLPDMETGKVPAQFQSESAGTSESMSRCLLLLLLFFHLFDDDDDDDDGGGG